MIQGSQLLAHMIIAVHFCHHDNRVCVHASPDHRAEGTFRVDRLTAGRNSPTMG